MDGTVGTGVFGTELTNLMSRDTLGSGAALNTPENLRTLRKVTKDGKLMLGVTIGREHRIR